MGKNALRVCAATLLLCTASLTVCIAQRAAEAQAQGVTGAGAQAADANSASPNVVPNKITGFTAWDDDFLYIAVQVTKPNLTGSNKLPFSDPLADDAVVVTLQSDNDHKSTSRTAHTVTMAVSEAGGTQLYIGEKSTPLFTSLDNVKDRLAEIDKTEKDPALQQSKRVALLGSIPKVQTTQAGAPRAGAGNYPGYTIEIAIPWSDLGGRPDVGAKLGFNVAATSKDTASPKVLSLAAGVHGLSDIDSPALLGELVLANEAHAGTAIELTSPRVVNNKPNIDGVLADNEWNRLAGFEFGERTISSAARPSLAATNAARLRPEFTPQAPRPVVVPADAPAGSTAVKAHNPYRVERLVFAQYEYGYQGDPRKEDPAQMVSNADHSSALAHHPLEGAGPWFSYDHAEWQRGQLAEMRKDGVDVVLPVFRADTTDRRAYADKGLLVLTSALGYLRRFGMDYPQVGMYLDTASMVTMLGDRMDLRDPAVQDALYGVIRDFYIRIPAEFRCCIALDPAEGARTAYPVFLSDAAAFKEWDSTFTTALRARFRADFNGADLVLIGSETFGARAGLDSYVSPAEGQAAAVGGWIKTSGVRAGFDLDVARSFAANATAMLPRREGTTYRNEWTAANARHPDWVLIQNWNDYTLGGEVAPSLEAGFGTADITRIYTHLFNGANKKLHAKFVWNDAPRETAAGSKFTVQVKLQNAGLESWGPVNSQIPVNVEYRWRKGGQLVSGRSEKIPTGLVGSGNEITVPVPVDTALKGSTLAPGDYTLEVGAVTGKGGSSEWSEEGGNTVQIPITLRQARTDGGAVTIIDSDMPDMMESGGVYHLSARLRNDGSTLWSKAEGYRVTARLYRVAASAGGATGLTETPVASADASTLLQNDVAPGDVAQVQVLLPITDPSGKPLPAWTPVSAFSYAVRWEVAPDHAGVVPASVQEGALPRVAGAVSALTVVGISDYDFGVRFTQDGTLPSLPGGRRLPVILGIKNIGPQTWKHDSVRIGYHWYYQDGSEFLWEDETTAIPHDLPPGEGVNNLMTYVTAPPCDGNYFLVWDVKFGETWASTSAVSRVLDEKVHSIQVTGGKLFFADLTKAYNLDGVTDLANLNGGDFDGKGRSFPAAVIPPFTDDGIVPAGIWQPYERTGPESPRHISFKWGSKEGRSNNFIACHGQRVELGKFTGKCRVVHIVAASVNTNVTTNIKLVFQEPSSESEDLYAFSVSRWDQPPVNGEDTVFTSKRVHTGSGSQDGVVSLYHYSFVIHDPRKIVALKLPDDRNIRIAAVTLEQ